MRLTSNTALQLTIEYSAGDWHLVLTRPCTPEYVDSDVGYPDVTRTRLAHAHAEWVHVRLATAEM